MAVKSSGTLLLMVSGGPDSMWMATAMILLYGESHDIVIVHCHHGMRKESDDELLMVKEFFEGYDVRCFLYE